MPKQILFDFLADLKMPLRDGLRSIGIWAHLTDDAIEPAKNLLPDPIRAQLHKAKVSVKQASQNLLIPPIDMDMIKTASRFLKGRDRSTEARLTFMLVVIHAWEQLVSASNHGYLISETVAADKLSRMNLGSQTSEADFASSVISTIRNSLAKLIPGSPADRPKPAQEADLDLVAIAIWLLASRAETVAEEEDLLELARALIYAMAPSSGEVVEDKPELARFLEEAAKHL